MNLTRLFLLLQGIGFCLFGLFCFFSPETMMKSLGAPSMSGGGIYELRGIYGGVSFGAGLLFLAGFLKTHMQIPALYFILAYTGGYALARIAALPLDGFPSGHLLGAFGFETVSAVIAAALLRRQGLQK